MTDGHKHKINREISFTYIVTNKKLTLVAAMGVTIGIAIFIFMNSLMLGFSKKSDDLIFKNNPHIHIYKDDEISTPLVHYAGSRHIAIIDNPMIVPESGYIVDPQQVMDLLRKQPFTTVVTPQVTVSIFYNTGKSQIPGNCSGVIIAQADQMFNIQSTMTEGRMEDLKSTPNGILLGVGVARKMSVRTGGTITVTSSKNVTRVMKVVGLFETHSSVTDKTKSYINIAAAQQLLLKGPAYVSDINVNIRDFEMSEKFALICSHLTGYRAEDWKEANASLVAASRVRTTMVAVISMSILLVAGFGIYNILNMTINQKINEIAILKAIGFQGRDVIRIFVVQGLVIGFIGILLGLLFATLLVKLLSKVYVGGDIGYFPIYFQPPVYALGAMIGFVICLFAGYIPARKAANVDPVSIFRK